jgi:hypothetical protein
MNDTPRMTNHISHSYATSRSSLHLIAVHIVARARVQATGRFSLRVTPGGFGTPEFGTEQRRVRVSGGSLIVESDEEGRASQASAAIDGASLRRLAEFARVDLDDPIDVGHDTPALGDLDAPLMVDETDAQALAAWLGLVNAALDRLQPHLSVHAEPTLVRLWPEHFDAAVEAAARHGVRANFGGSVGDGFNETPYLYVGPWTADRPGGGDFWNAPFGAARAVADIPDIAAAVDFYSEGLSRLGVD